MDRTQKEVLVNDLREMYNSHDYVFVVNVSGLPSNSNNAMRKKIIRVNGVSFVIKNTLNKIAIQNTKHNVINDVLKGQNMSIFAKDPVEAAKIIADLSKEENSGVKIIGVSDGKSFFGAEYVKNLAKMPSMDVIRASLLSVIQSVQRKIVYSLSYSSSAVVRVIGNNFEQK